MGVIRTLLALVVLLAHSPNEGLVFVGGRLAVELFYMISGFLIAHVLTCNPAYTDPLRFYANRALRLYPIYFAVVILTLLALPLTGQALRPTYDLSSAGARALLVLSNLLLLGQDWVMFATVSEGHLAFTTNFAVSPVLLYHGLIVPQAWTLGVEISFYLVAPLLLRKKTMFFLVLGLSLAIKVALHLQGLGRQDPWSFRFFPAELALFLLGALSQAYLLPLWQRVVARAGLSWLPTGATVVIVAMIAGYAVVPPAGSLKALVLFAAFLVLLPATFLFQNASPMDKRIGDLSYPIYIGHWLVVMLIAAGSRKLPWQPTNLTLLWANLVGTIVFAHGLNRLIGAPVERVRARLRHGPG